MKITKMSDITEYKHQSYYFTVAKVLFSVNYLPVPLQQWKTGLQHYCMYTHKTTTHYSSLILLCYFFLKLK